jgi:hypothetical protein
MGNYREEALVKLVDNNVSAANMEVWIAGYITGRKVSEESMKERVFDKNIILEDLLKDGKNV